MVSLDSWANSDIGRKRARNEDFFFEDNDLGLFIVADGMGGHSGGDLASRVAIKSAVKKYREMVQNGFATLDSLKAGFQNAARSVYEESLTSPRLKGMGTTFTALALENHGALIAHIGDSRIYRMRNGELKQLTTDHSFVHEQVQAGLMSPEEAQHSSLRNIITRAIGHNKNVEADYFSTESLSGDRFLLCTDGLNNLVLDSEIQSILRKNPTKNAVDELINEANQKGGDDNITAILVVIK